MSASKKQAQLKIGDEPAINLPILTGSQGTQVVDVTGLAKTGFYTFDPGFMSTASCESHITFIDGQNGCLLHRGYPIEELAEHCDYLTVCYLLLNGELPTRAAYQTFVAAINKRTSIPQDIAQLFAGLPKQGHPMALLMSAVSALAAYSQAEGFDINDSEARQQAALDLVAKMPVLAAMCYRHTAGLPFIKPRTELGYTANFLNMLFAKSDDDTPPNETLVKAMDHIFILHADHSQNASTSTLRLAGSTGVHPCAAVVAAIAALWGPAHGGANEACLAMLEAIGDVSRIPDYIAKAKDPKDPFRLMGFGHRVYKNYDPRARIMREACYNVLSDQGKDDEPLFKVAMELEKIALEDDYFKSRSLYPNVDFYSGITQNAMGIPTDLFTVIFALGRTVGWVSHWLEMVASPQFRLSRPRQLYKGYTQRSVTDNEESKK